MENKESKPLYSEFEDAMFWHPNERVNQISQRLRVIEREFSSNVRWATLAISIGSLGFLGAVSGINTDDYFSNVARGISVAFSFGASVYNGGRALHLSSEASSLNSALATYLLNEKPPVTNSL